jgi:hypothetical protein
MTTLHMLRAHVGRSQPKWREGSPSIAAENDAETGLPIVPVVFRRRFSMRTTAYISLVLCALLTVPTVLSATAATTEQLLKELKSLPQTDMRPLGCYYDMHGNANEELQTLMIRRFEATEAVCRAIDSVSVKSHPGYAVSLYDVLTTVKDPASIWWLERSLKGPKKQETCDHWLSGWSVYLRGAAPSQTKWLTGREQWSKFFRAWASSETDAADRLRVLLAMQGWLHDPATQDFFASLEKNGKTTAEELLLAQLYLRQHGKPFDEAKLKAAILRLRKSAAGEKTLLRYATALRHEAFVPPLIEMADRSIEENFMTPQRALEAITFQRNIKGRRSWNRWYEANGAKGRKAWMEEAASRLSSLATTNMPAAIALLSEANYDWDDPAMLPHMERLASFKPLHSEIVGWINLTCHEAPFLRDELRPLASKIRKESETSLEDWAKNLMQDWDFFGRDKTTWPGYIRLNNRAV